MAEFTDLKGSVVDGDASITTLRIFWVEPDDPEVDTQWMDAEGRLCLKASKLLRDAKARNAWRWDSRVEGWVLNTQPTTSTTTSSQACTTTTWHDYPEHDFKPRFPGPNYAELSDDDGGDWEPVDWPGRVAVAFLAVLLLGLIAFGVYVLWRGSTL